MRLRERIRAESRDAVNSRCIHSILQLIFLSGTVLFTSALTWDPVLYCSHVTTTNSENRDVVSYIISRPFLKAAHGDKAYA
jgi:hypothetical protein